MSDYLSKALRTTVATRANGCCEYCRSQARFATQSFAIDHIDAPDPVSRQQVALYHPRQQVWDEHFAWSKDFLLIIGITAVGRATVEALRLNREPLVNLRRALYGIGEHPPE